MAAAASSLKIHFLRHGQTQHSKENHFCGSGLNPDLTDDGREMAACFAAAWKDVQWAAIYSSPLTRALSTARHLADPLSLTIHERDELKEIGYGEWEGLSADEVNHKFHDDYIRWTADPAWCPPTSGEPATAIAQRGMRIVDEIKHDHPAGNVLVVSHKATIRIILCNLLGIDVGRFRFRLDCPVCSLSVVEITRQGPWLRTLADRSHLTPRLRNLPGT